MGEAAVLAVVFVLGSAIGSFLNVVVYRLPAGISIAWPPSRCPVCVTRLGARENLPILGWLWLRGRCAHCRAPISGRYPLVEAGTAVLFCLTYQRFGLSPETLGIWVFLSWLVALALIDWDTLTLPNRLTQSGLVVGLLYQGLIGWGTTFTPGGIIAHLMTGIGGAVLGLWLLDVIALGGTALLGQPAMGAGDAKLAALIGAWLGWKMLLIAALVAAALGALIGTVAITLGWLERRQPMPFGPFLAVGGAISAFWGSQLLNLYTAWFFPTL